jgi:hypothetical protein
MELVEEQSLGLVLIRQVANWRFNCDGQFMDGVSMLEKFERQTILQRLVPAPQRFDIGSHREVVNTDAKFVVADGQRAVGYIHY